MSPHETIRELEYKYGKIGASFEDLENYVVNLEPELSIPLDEAMVDYKRWLDAKKEIEEISITEDNEEVEVVDETDYHAEFGDLRLQ